MTSGIRQLFACEIDQYLDNRNTWIIDSISRRYVPGWGLAAIVNPHAPEWGSESKRCPSSTMKLEQINTDEGVLSGCLILTFTSGPDEGSVYRLGIVQYDPDAMEGRWSLTPWDEINCIAWDSVGAVKRVNHDLFCYSEIATKVGQYRADFMFSNAPAYYGEGGRPRSGTGKVTNPRNSAGFGARFNWHAATIADG